MATACFVPRLQTVACLRLPHRARVLASTRCFASARSPRSVFDALDAFPERHIGPDEREVSFMLSNLGYDSMEAFVEDTVPAKIRLSANAMSNTSIPALSETELFARIKELGRKNKSFKSYIGLGYHNAVVPPVILRNVSHLSPTLLILTSGA
jgi:glycine dehydrogenase